MSRTFTFLAGATFLAYTLVIWFGEAYFLPPNEADWCLSAKLGYPNVIRYDNPDYNNNPCFKERPWQLLYVCQMECDFARRILSSMLMGAAIGFERKASDRPAGIRTMSLVCLGSCFFTMCGQVAFRSSTMGWDAARVSAAIPAGVGFLGAGLIWKGTVGQKPDERHEVHGLTTAASVWLSAAVGVGAGGRLYVISVYAVALVIMVLRIGPRMYFAEDSESFMDYDDTTSESSEYSSSTTTSSVLDDQLSSGDEASDAEAKEGKDTGTNTGKIDPALNLSRDRKHRYHLLRSEPRKLAREESKPSVGNFMSAPDLRSMGGDEDDEGFIPDAFRRCNSAPLSEYEGLIKDESGGTAVKRQRRRRHRHRSYSARRRRFLGPSFHS